MKRKIPENNFKNYLKEIMMTTTTTPDMQTIKTRMKATWMAGDYGTFAKYMEPGALETDKQALLRQDLEEVFSAHNRATDGTTTLEGEYLEVVAVRS
jgi:hypothetical protein